MTMENKAKESRVLELMIEEMDGRSMDRLVSEWNEWGAPRVQRPAIQRWLRGHPRTNEVNLIRLLRVEQLRAICRRLGVEVHGLRLDLERRVLLESLVDDEDLAVDSPEAQRFREEIMAMYDDREDIPEITPAAVARLPQPFLSVVPRPADNGTRGFARVGGMLDLKDLLRREVIDAIREPELYRRYGLRIPNGLLLYGPPGCGKTFITRALVEELDRPLFEVTPGSVASPFIHETVRRLTEVFNQALSQAPAVVFLDELDALAPDRAILGGGDIHKAEELAQLLLLLDNAGQAGVFVIGATNRPDRIDLALLRSGRFDHKVQVDLPDREAIAAILELEFQRRWCDPDLDPVEVAALLVGQTCAETIYAVDGAARRALATGGPIGREHF